jgi:hypothetical protein
VTKPRRDQRRDNQTDDQGNYRNGKELRTFANGVSGGAERPNAIEPVVRNAARKKAD